MHRLDEFGFTADNFKFDIDKIVARARATCRSSCPTASAS